MTDKHTYIIPAFGDSPFLEECIQSLLHQSVKSNILITTSTPSDFIFNLAQKYQLNVLVNPESNRGIASDWNFAFAQATTQYVTLAHQDEVYYADFTKNLEQKIFSNPKKRHIIIFTDYREMIDTKLRNQPSIHARIKKMLLFPFLIKPSIQSKLVRRAVLSMGTPICCSSVTYHLALLKDFSFSEQFKVALDWKAWLTLAEKDGNFSFINNKLIGHRIHSGTETFRQIQSGARYEEELAIYSSIWGKKIAKLWMKFYVYGHNINT